MWRRAASLILLIPALCLLSAAGPRRTPEEAAAPVRTVLPSAVEDISGRGAVTKTGEDRIRQTGETRGRAEDTADPIEGEATRIVTEIIKGISEGDYKRYIGNFSKKLKKAQSRETFLLIQKSMQKSLGKFRSVKYLGHYVQSGNTITLFKARFKKDKDDVLIKLVLRGKGANLRVTGIWFDSPRLSK
jgi:hypothetical protein